VGQEIRKPTLDTLEFMKAARDLRPALGSFAYIDLPDLPRATRSTTSLQAEREFLFSAEDCLFRFPLCGSRGENRATLAAIPSPYAICKSLQAAKLRPVSLTIGIASLQDGAAFRKLSFA
jgi:hypothetical protein